MLRNNKLLRQTHKDKVTQILHPVCKDRAQTIPDAQGQPASHSQNTSQESSASRSQENDTSQVPPDNLEEHMIAWLQERANEDAKDPQKATERRVGEVERIICCTAGDAEDIWGIHPADLEDVKARKKHFHGLLIDVHPDKVGSDSKVQAKANKATISG